ncbi:MAG TPA: phospholipase D-like domain-containing protein [Burkholderiaceae bacterium]|nr:phospholipase D-like domain-containing protein [Burkholderiaceae bacterium]
MRASGAIGVVLAALAAVAAVPGCTVLDQRLAFPAPRAERAVPRVVDARGAVSPQRAEALIARLEKEGHTGLVARHLAFMDQLGSAPLIVGNATRLLVDGPETHRAMFDAIARARRHVHLQTYILEGDETGRRLADLLVERRRQGVQVSVMYDAIGGIRTPKEYFDRLREAGVAVCEANPVDPRAGRGVTLNNRDHRKILVVDGRAAYTGGVNVSDVYASGSASARRRAERGAGWRDTHLEVRGPAVAEFQRLFLDSWVKQGCPAQPEAGWFPKAVPEGDRVLRVLASSPDRPDNPIRDELLSAMAHAERSIHVTMAYFVPDPTTLEVLEAAARRGVDVQLVLPGFSDFWMVHAAGRAHYDRLLAAGVRIFERRDALLHAKTAVVDGIWSTVGSANMDWRSFLHNDEVNVVVVGEGFGREMEALFREDVARAEPIEPAEWARRGPIERAKEALARLAEYWL